MTVWERWSVREHTKPLVKTAPVIMSTETCKSAKINAGLNLLEDLIADLKIHRDEIVPSRRKRSNTNEQETTPTISRMKGRLSHCSARK